MTKSKAGRVWSANRTSGNCGLTGKAIREDDKCLFLTCAGDEARPQYQIRETGEESYIDGRGRERSRKVRETPEGRQFRTVPTGQHRCRRNACAEVYSYWQQYCTAPHPDPTKKGNCRSRTKPIFKWQEQDSEGRWHDVFVWEKVVHADAAVALGYYVPTRSNGAFVETEAADGTRTEGHAHTVAQAAESPLMDLARAALSPEEMGEAPPIVPSPIPEAEGVARFLKLDLDDSPEPTPAPPKVDPSFDTFGPDDLNDPQIMRFRGLDLD